VNDVFIGAMSTFEDAFWRADEGFPADRREETEAGAFALVCAEADVRIHAFRS
jgi:hypothetical protein